MTDSNSDSNTTRPAITAAPGTIVMFSDLICPFAHIAVHRIVTARERLGLADQVVIDHHVFPIELLNTAPGTRHGSDSEIPALGRLEPDAGWQIWQGPDYHYPNTVLLAFESVQAVKRRSLQIAEALDRALRHAFWAQSRPIQLHHEILDIAATITDLDVEALRADLRSGVARSAIFDDLDTVRTGAVSLSPHLFLPNGDDYTNPGMAVHWQGEWAKGFPVVDGDDPGIYDTIVTTAAADGR